MSFQDCIAFVQDEEESVVECDHHDGCGGCLFFMDGRCDHYYEENSNDIKLDGSLQDRGAVR